MNKIKYSKKAGFTLIEILITLAIIIFILATGLIFGMDFYRTHAFYSERDLIVTILEKARNESLNNINQSPHGIYFNSSSHVIFQGNSYELRNSIYDIVIPAAPILRSGSQEIVFSQLSGEASTLGIINLSSKNISAIITVNNEGQINW